MGLEREVWHSRGACAGLPINYNSLAGRIWLLDAAGHIGLRLLGTDDLADVMPSLRDFPARFLNDNPIGTPSWH